jgi:hypothetical protein
MGKKKDGEKKKRGFFRRIFRLAFLAGLVAGVAQFLKRRRSGGAEDSDWHELPPPTT